MNKAASDIYKFFETIIIRHRRVVVVITSLMYTALANYLAFVIRFELIISPAYLTLMLSYLPVLVLIRLFFYLQATLYKDIWSYSSISEMVRIIKSITLGSITFFVVVRYVLGNTFYPYSIFILDWLLLIIITGGSRLFIRFFREYVYSQKPGKKILIVGAGNAGEIIVRDIKNNPESVYEPIGFIDEDPYKKGLAIRGIPIFGPISLIPYVIEVHKPDEILFTVSSTNNNEVKKIYELCKPYNIPIKKLPGMSEILEGNISVATKLGQHLIDAGLVTEDKVQQALSLQKIEGGRLGSKLVKLGYIAEEKLVSFLNKQFGISHMKPISLEDLLQREPVRTDIQSVRDFIENKSVLVTGAGGSIGSELCRQIMKYSPSNLILFERYENSLFNIDLELKNEAVKNNGKFKSRIISIIGDIVDVSSLEQVFSKHRPQIVFHAAAHKHVPLMEDNPLEAVRNNILGTKNILDISAKYDIESFVMISTDKAVNPTSVMGATKRVAELLTIEKNAEFDTKFTTVRFGNVLGSNGSVVPTFREQLKNGGPLTVTHPDMKRFFMLVPEAVQLVLLAAAIGNGGEIFVLDMGDQIKICDLAENLIRLSGFTPNEEIKVTYTGLRPGEKLYEELFDSSEKIISTVHEKLRIAIPEVPLDGTAKYILEFEHIVMSYSIERIIPLIQELVPNFKPTSILDTDNKQLVI